MASASIASSGPSDAQLNIDLDRPQCLSRSPHTAGDARARRPDLRRTMSVHTMSHVTTSSSSMSAPRDAADEQFDELGLHPVARSLHGQHVVGDRRFLRECTVAATTERRAFAYISSDSSGDGSALDAVAERRLGVADVGDEIAQLLRARPRTDDRGPSSCDRACSASRRCTRRARPRQPRCACRSCDRRARRERRTRLPSPGSTAGS